MNERIKELADKAAWRTRMAHNNAYWRMQDEIAEDITWREKFAELIVRECAGVAWGIYANQEIANGIKQHFGVEE